MVVYEINPLFYLVPPCILSRTKPRPLLFGLLLFSTEEYIMNYHTKISPSKNMQNVFEPLQDLNKHYFRNS